MKAQHKASIPKSTISPEGHIPLPESVLQALSLKPGDQVRFFILEGEVRILPVLPGNRLAGSLRYNGPPISLEQMDEDIAKAACESAGARY